MPEFDLATALDQCIASMRSGASLEACLNRYPEHRAELEPLLREAWALQTEPEVHIDVQTRHQLRAELRTAIKADQRASAGKNPETARPETLGRQAKVTSRFRLPSWRFAFVPALAVALAAALLITSPFGTSEVAEAGTTLTVLEGPVFIQSRQGLVPAQNGMLLRENDRVITRANARAVLTFFDGSTVTLEPDTVILLKKIRRQNRALIARLIKEQGRAGAQIPANLRGSGIQIEEVPPQRSLQEATPRVQRTPVATRRPSTTP